MWLYVCWHLDSSVYEGLLASKKKRGHHIMSPSIHHFSSPFFLSPGLCYWCGSRGGTRRTTHTTRCQTHIRHSGRCMDSHLACGSPQEPSIVLTLKAVGSAFPLDSPVSTSHPGNSIGLEVSVLFMNLWSRFSHVSTYHHESSKAVNDKSKSVKYCFHLP